MLDEFDGAATAAFEFSCCSFGSHACYGTGVQEKSAIGFAGLSRIDRQHSAVRRLWDVASQALCKTCRDTLAKYQGVIARQRSLAEALEQFRELDRQGPDLRAGIKSPSLDE